MRKNANDLLDIFIINYRGYIIKNFYLKIQIGFFEVLLYYNYILSSMKNIKYIKLINFLIIIYYY